MIHETKVSRRKLLESTLAAPFILCQKEALALDLFPNGGSCAGSLAQPAPAAAWGYDCLALSDDFTSLNTIDTTNSQAPGFNWYLGSSWSHVNNTGGIGGAWVSPASGPPNVSDLSVSDSVLTLTNSQGGSYFSEQSLNTAFASGASYGGKVFTGGCYYEASMKFDPTLANTSRLQCDPILWMIAIEFLIGTANEFVENDIIEVFPTGMGSVSTQIAVHDWFANTGRDSENSNFGWNSTGLDFTQFHTYGFLWVPMAKNGGTGLLKRYIDGVNISANDISYSATGPATPGMSNNFNGILSEMDSQHFCFMLGCGPNWPIQVDYVRVWQ